ncbi:MAG TPA: DUF1579 domain-containing protein [Longimicrobium sp.]|nr:DUF1579 domain-containing protein [Longimicrobium sp.]
MDTERRKEHEWLDQLVGEWSYESESIMNPGEPPFKTSGTESVRSLGGFWTVAEGEFRMSSATGTTSTITTLGFDPARGRFAGTFIGSMMPNLWLYDGELDADGKRLTLRADGPGYPDGEGTTTYHDVIWFEDEGHRVMTSSVLQPDGTWNTFMTVHYRRK